MHSGQKPIKNKKKKIKKMYQHVKKQINLSEENSVKRKQKQI